MVLIVITLTFSFGTLRQELAGVVEWKTQEIPKVVERLEKRIDAMESKEASNHKLEMIRQNQIMTQEQIKQLNGWTLLIMKKLNIPVTLAVEADS